MCSKSAFIPHGSKRGLGRETETLLFPDYAALASQPSEVFPVGAEPGVTRELPSETVVGREALSRPSNFAVHFSLSNAPPLVPLPTPARHWKPLARSGTAFLSSPGHPSYSPGLQTFWPVIVKGNISYIMIGHI